MSAPAPLQIPPQIQNLSNHLPMQNLEPIYQALVIAKEEELAEVKLWLLWDLELLAYQRKDLTRLQIVRDEMERLAEVQRENEEIEREILEIRRERKEIQKVLKLQSEIMQLQDELDIKIKQFNQEFDEFYLSVAPQMSLPILPIDN